MFLAPDVLTAQHNDRAAQRNHEQRDVKAVAQRTEDGLRMWRLTGRQLRAVMERFKLRFGGLVSLAALLLSMRGRSRHGARPWRPTGNGRHGFMVLGAALVGKALTRARSLARSASRYA